MLKDKLTRKAKLSGYRARSVYKLIQVNNKYRLIKNDDVIIDLGCWPGSWTQYASKFGKVYSVDIKEIKNLNCIFIKKDVFDNELLEKLPRANVLLSDLSTNTTGDKLLDQENSLELCYRALEIAREKLNLNGNFLCKIFQSNKLNDFLNEVKKNFRFVKCFKPVASKKHSKEIYVVGLGFKI